MRKENLGRSLLLSIVIFLFIGIISVSASSKQRVYDDANLLTDAEIQQLEKVARESSENRETDFIILTVDDAKKDIVKYMQDIYDEEAFGYNQSHGNAAILTIEMKTRDIYLAGFYKGEEYLDNERMDLIREKITPDLSSENYYRAFESFITIGDKYMGYRPGVNPENILFKWWFQIFISLGVAFVALGAMIRTSGGKVTTNARTYRDDHHSKVLRRKDQYLRKTVTKRRKPKSSSSGGSGGGGGRTSGGHSHSGSRGKF